MKINELFGAFYGLMLAESVFDVLDSIPRVPNIRETNTLTALVMYVITNDQRPGILQLNSFYLQDDKALHAELQRLSTNHPTEFYRAREYVLTHSVETSKQLVRRFFAAKQNNIDLTPRPANLPGPRLPQRPVGGDRERMQVAGRRR